jgi:hypothetical protein
MPKKLDNAFQATIDKITRQTPAKSAQGIEILKWTFLAERQLTVAELCHALATSDHAVGKSLNQNDLPFQKSLTECCHGLVVLDKETSSIRLVHKSLQDFLKKQHEADALFSAGHHDLAYACFVYLVFSCQDRYFHTLANGRQCNVILFGLLDRCLILLCSPGSALGLMPLLSSLAQAILTRIQNVSAVLPLGLCNSVLSSSGRRLGCL